MDTKISEFALIGDAYLKLELTKKLVVLGLSNSEITVLIGKFLSNAYLSEIASNSGLPTGSSIHANGTLLEAMVGYWLLAASVAQYDISIIHDANAPIFKALVDFIYSSCLDASQISVLSFFKKPEQPADLGMLQQD